MQPGSSVSRRGNLWLRLFALLLFVFAAPGRGAADDEKVDYKTQVKPIFASRCFACHGALKQESGLRLDTAELMRKGGENGAALVPGDAAKSPLIERITADDEFTRMPPEGKPLTKKQIAAITAWIEQGGAAPSDEQPEQDPRQHWSFTAPVRRDVPEVKNAGWVRNPIDAFLAARHEELGVVPVRPAEKHELLRRVYIDLIGLPPTREELHAFLADESPDAFEKVVGRLLDSPQYGERWGRHWMDVWRYSDWYGRRSVNDVRNSYPHIWRWRDWIVRSLNEDKGYDRMIHEMLAADEIAPEDDETIPALGFIVRNWFSLNYETWKQDLVEHTGKAFLGLRFNCAHCHDHKYDPILQKEYFQFRAFFEPLELRQDRVPGGPALVKYLRYPALGGLLKPIEAGLPRVYDHYFDEQTYMYQLGDPRNRFDRPPVEPGVPPFLGGPPIEVEQVKLPAVASYPGLKPFVQQAEVEQRQQAVDAARTELAQAKTNLPKLAEAAAAAEAALAEARAKLADAEKVGEAANPVVERATDAAGYWRFEGADDASGFLADSSGNGHVLERVTATDPPAAPVKLGEQAAGRFFFNPTPGGKLANVQAARFNQTSSYAYLATAGEGLHADRFTLDACVHFDVAAPNFNRTIASLDGSWTLLHRGLDANTFELRLLATNPQGNVRDVATAAGDDKLILKTGQDYFVAVVLDEQSITFYAKNLTEAGAIQSRSFPRNAGGQDFAQLAKPPEGGRFKIGNSDGTGRVVGLIDEVRYAREAASAEEIAAVSAASPADVLRAGVSAAEAKLAYARQQVAAAERAVQPTVAKLAAAEAELAAIEARIAADKAKYQGGPGDADELAAAAATAERQAKLAAAKQKQALAQAAVRKAKADAKALKKAQSALAAADKAVAAAEKALSETNGDYTPLSPKYPEHSTGRRTALARWIGSEENPLTARVAVNHIWMRHFGRPIVESVFDFGRSGKLPSHPQLIDWLAAELMQPTVAPLPEHGWSMKHIHRLIVTSSAYRISSHAPADSPNYERDKDNRSWWKFDRRRMQAEVVRDSILHLAGSLDETIGGQELDPKLEATTQRRSMYYAVYPEGGGMMQFMATFDPADPIDCYRRKKSIVPQQALALSNSELAVHHGRLLARKLSEQTEKETNDPAARQAAFVTAAFEQILARPPTDKERQFCAEFIAKQLALYEQSKQQPGAAPKGVVAAAADSQVRARESLVRVLLNHNDFVTIH